MSLFKCKECEINYAERKRLFDAYLEKNNDYNNLKQTHMAFMLKRPDSMPYEHLVAAYDGEVKSGEEKNKEIERLNKELARQSLGLMCANCNREHSTPRMMLLCCETIWKEKISELEKQLFQESFLRTNMTACCYCTSRQLEMKNTELSLRVKDERIEELEKQLVRGNHIWNNPDAIAVAAASHFQIQQLEKENAELKNSIDGLGAEIGRLCFDNNRLAKERDELKVEIEQFKCDRARQQQMSDVKSCNCVRCAGKFCLWCNRCLCFCNRRCQLTR